MKLSYTLTALRQIDQALVYVEARSPQGAAAIRDQLNAALTSVQDHPYAAQATNRRGVRRLGLAPYPYVLFYRVLADQIVVTRFRHAARRPSKFEG